MLTFECGLSLTGFLRISSRFYDYYQRAELCVALGCACCAVSCLQCYWCSDAVEERSVRSRTESNRRERKAKSTSTETGRQRAEGLQERCRQIHQPRRTVSQSMTCRSSTCLYTVFYRFRHRRMQALIQWDRSSSCVGKISAEISTIRYECVVLACMCWR